MNYRDEYCKLKKSSPILLVDDRYIGPPKGAWGRFVYTQNNDWVTVKSFNKRTPLFWIDPGIEPYIKVMVYLHELSHYKDWCKSKRFSSSKTKILKSEISAILFSLHEAKNRDYKKVFYFIIDCITAFDNAFIPSMPIRRHASHHASHEIMKKYKKMLIW